MIRSRMSELMKAAVLMCILAQIAACSPNNSRDNSELDSQGSGETPVVEDLRIVVVGHLYGLYVKDHANGEILTEDVLEVFVKEVNKLDPDAVFILGDLTYKSLETEWAMLSPHLGRLKGAQFYIPGNHDRIDIDVFNKYGGRGNETIVLGNTKFVTLHATSIYSPKDIRFVKTELSDHEQYDNVIVMMHYRSFEYKSPSEAPEGHNVYKTYSGYSNWNEDVAPLLKGKVDYVFCGDLFHKNTGHFRDEENGLTYICNSFQFRADGPLVYLELSIGADGEIAILPHTLPLDLRNGWYDMTVNGE